ncbi:MAG: tRNA (adenosine(37)-N6)-threonylcarbamoyltransferase complex ATPase subunit type 1 TsaE [Candidatus Acidiferrales bacterium]
MPDLEILTRSADETIEQGRSLGARLKPPVLILLSGELGAGKTTFTKGLVAGLGAASEDEVTSPTFTLIHKYDRGPRAYHIDLYRIADAHDLSTLGIEDIFDETTVVIVEWPEKLNPNLDWPVLRICLEHVDENTRRIRMEGSVAAAPFA